MRTKSKPKHRPRYAPGEEPTYPKPIPENDCLWGVSHRNLSDLIWQYVYDFAQSYDIALEECHQIALDAFCRRAVIDLLDFYANNRKKVTDERIKNVLCKALQTINVAKRIHRFTNWAIVYIRTLLENLAVFLNRKRKEAEKLAESTDDYYTSDEWGLQRYYSPDNIDYSDDESSCSEFENCVPRRLPIYRPPDDELSSSSGAEPGPSKRARPSDDDEASDSEDSSSSTSSTSTSSTSTSSTSTSSSSTSSASTSSSSPNLPAACSIWKSPYCDQPYPEGPSSAHEDSTDSSRKPKKKKRSLIKKPAPRNSGINIMAMAGYLRNVFGLKSVRQLNKSVACNCCNYWLPNPCMMRRHRAIVHKKHGFFQPPPKCNHCGLVVRAYTHLLKHLKTVHKDTKHPCRFCSATFDTYDMKRYHQNTHIKPCVPFVCKLCDQGRFTSYKHFLQHCMVHAKEIED